MTALEGLEAAANGCVNRQAVNESRQRASYLGDDIFVESQVRFASTAAIYTIARKVLLEDAAHREQTERFKNTRRLVNADFWPISEGVRASAVFFFSARDAYQ